MINNANFQGGLWRLSRSLIVGGSGGKGFKWKFSISVT
jgi:hypothetical protein